MLRRRLGALVLTAAAVLTTAQAAHAVHYPPPANPTGQSGKPKGPFRTLHVCRHGRHCFRRIQDAVTAARAGDTIRVAHGTYREGVSIIGARKRYIKVIGDPRDPAKVVLDGKGIKKANGMLVNGADEVTLDGFTARHYSANGFFATNVTGYHLRHLHAFLTGVYGIYAFNSVGGEMTDGEAAWNNDSGLYIGQTPPQAKPKRSMVRNMKVYGNVVGFSGTNMRYVTITRSQFFNNGLGIVPNALDSEKYAPPEDNVITGNDIFWNNFDYYAGAPFPLHKSATGTPYPIGVGILLFGSRRTEITNNRIFGNWLMGVGGLQQILLKQKDAQDLVGNRIMDNEFGAGGADLNGRDIFYDGSGSDNCVGPNAGVQVTVPADASTFRACPFTGQNTFDGAAQGEAVNWAIGDPTHEKYWIRHDHAARAGASPLEHYVAGSVK